MAPTVPPSSPTASSPPAPARPGATVWYAQRHILHGDKVITRGSKLPADFPKDSLELLAKDKTVAQSPPPDPEKSGIKKKP